MSATLTPAVSIDTTDVEILPFKGRSVAVGDYVECFLNIHESRKQGEPWYSIRKDGLTVAHASCVTLSDASFVVSEKGRQKVLETGRKNVHAIVRGTLCESDLSPDQPVRYNPFHTATFVDADGQPVHSAELVTLCEARAFIR